MDKNEAGSFFLRHNVHDKHIGDIYAGCNCIFSECYNVSEVIQLQLQETVYQY